MKVSPTEKIRESLNTSGRFTLKTVSTDKVKKIIQSLKPKRISGLDFISPIVLKASADAILEPLTHIIHSSITECVLPTSWKAATITPIYKKKGRKTDKANYRPVSNAISFSKVLEKIVNEQVIKYIECNQLLPNCQHGFRTQRSTFKVLANMHEDCIKENRKRNHIAVLIFDLSAAFDTISPIIIMNKLELYGFDQKSRNWFYSYLTKRTQRKMLGDYISKSIETNCDTPQGAILSTTIFNILIADIQLHISATITGYADDTTATIIAENQAKLIISTEQEAKNILNYMVANKLAANEIKTAALFIRPTNQTCYSPIKLKLGTKLITKTKVENLLGISISSDLKWHVQIRSLSQSLYHRLFII